MLVCLATPQAHTPKVKGSRVLFSGGQGVKTDFWLVKILDPGSGQINRPYGSDTPLVCETDWSSMQIQ